MSSKIMIQLLVPAYFVTSCFVLVVHFTCFKISQEISCDRGVSMQTFAWKKNNYETVWLSQSSFLVPTIQMCLFPSKMKQYVYWEQPRFKYLLFPAGFFRFA